MRTVTPRERIVGDAHIRMKKKTLKTASSIIIATWLDKLHDLRRKIRCRKTTSIIWNCATTESELMNNSNEKYSWHEAFH